MKIRGPLVNKLGGLAVTGLIYPWMSTLQFHGDAEDWRVDPTEQQFEGPAIFVFWHEYIPILFYLRGHCHITMLVSRHQDAEWLSQAAKLMGFGTVRGSTNRGGAASAAGDYEQEPMGEPRDHPRRPRGPRRELAVGCVYLASRLKMPIVPIGLGYDRPWRIKKAWDQFAIPKPFSRMRDRRRLSPCASNRRARRTRRASRGRAEQTQRPDGRSRTVGGNGRASAWRFVAQNVRAALTRRRNLRKSTPKRLVARLSSYDSPTARANSRLSISSGNRTAANSPR